jgi:hypothetical protein
LIRTIGVSPTVSRMLPNLAISFPPDAMEQSRSVRAESAMAAAGDES